MKVKNDFIKKIILSGKNQHISGKWCYQLRPLCSPMSEEIRYFEVIRYNGDGIELVGLYTIEGEKI